MKIQKLIKKPAFVILTILFLLGAFYLFSGKEEQEKNFEKVVRKDITQIVSESGQVVPLKDLDLQFETQSKVADIKVNVGQEIAKGDVLMSLSNKNAKLDVLSAEASRDIAQANLDKILEGASNEKIEINKSAVEKAEAEVQSAKTTIQNKETNLANVKQDVKDDLQSSYDDALNTLSDTYIKICNAYNVADQAQRSYFMSSTQEDLKVKSSTNEIEEDKAEAKEYLDLTQDDESYSDIDTALEEFRKIFNSTAEELRIIREITQEPQYRGDVSSSDKTSLDNQKSYINTALSNIVNAQQDIRSTKNTNQSNIDTAEANLESAKNSLESAKANLKYNQNKLEEIRAEAQDYEIRLEEAKLAQAKASLAQARENLSKTKLTSPCNGIISDLNIEEGEIAKTSDVVTNLICQNSYQIEAEIPEADIGKIDLQDKVKISLDAFPEKEFTGKVNEIDPAETTIQGVVYYKIKVVFDKFNKSIKPGMTTDIEIITEKKANVLTIPRRLVIRKNNKKIVNVLEGKESREQLIKTGITNDQGEIEIISGLKEGDKIIR